MEKKAKQAEVILLEGIVEEVEVTVEDCDPLKVHVLLTRPWGDGLWIALTSESLEGLAKVAQAELNSGKVRKVHPRAKASRDVRFDNEGNTGISALYGHGTAEVKALVVKKQDDDGSISSKTIKRKDSSVKEWLMQALHHKSTAGSSQTHADEAQQEGATHDEQEKR